MYNPDLNDYQLTSIISEGCGGTAVVYSALYKPKNQYVAIKRFFVDKCKENASLIEQDIQTRKELQHPNILPYLISFVHGRELYIVSPLMNLGSCRDILDQYFQDGLPELACAIILRDVLHGLQYLHSQLYVHRSVCARHVVVGAGGAVLGGLRAAARRVEGGRRVRALHALPRHHHLACLSPELLEQNLKGYDERSDIYSVGVLCCELGNGGVPFLELPNTLLFTEKVRGTAPQLLDCSTCPEPLDNSDIKSMYSKGEGLAEASTIYSRRKLSDAFHAIAAVALQREPEKRPSASQLLSHPFFKQIRKADHLLSLLGRVKPIKPEPGDMSALLLQEKLSEMDIEKSTEWDF